MVYFSDDNAGAGEWSPRHPALLKIDTALTGCQGGGATTAPNFQIDILLDAN